AHASHGSKFSGQVSGSHNVRILTGVLSISAHALAAATSSGDEPTGSNRESLIRSPDYKAVVSAKRRLSVIENNIRDRCRQLHPLNTLNMQGGINR
ncbi:hypothetical protein K791_23176, partial [Salmonella enterica subsp. enterica serovar Newport str. SHSN001]